jgi:hypothetical protein
MKLKDILRVQPTKLEEYYDDLGAAARTFEACKERLKYIAMSYPALLKKYELGKQSWVNHITDPVAAYHTLFSESSDWQSFMRECCDISLPRLAGYIAKLKGCEVPDAEKMIFEILGQRYAGDGPEIGGLIESKPKERALRKKK